MGERTHGHALELTAFFPYRLAVLAERVSEAVAQVYADRFQLTRAEWRVLAALAANRRMAGNEIGPYSTLDKMQVSRAVARLESRGLVTRATDARDRRAKLLSLTPEGAALFAKIAPLAQAREQYLLESLDAAERDALDRAMKAVLQRAEGLASRG